MNKKYNKKMTDMIQHAYRKAGNGVNQLETATTILEDFNEVWPGSDKVSKLTAEKIRSKFQSLQTQGIYVVSKATYKSHMPMSKEPDMNKASMKELMIHLMNKSDKLNFNLKDGKVTIEFNL